MSLYNSRQVIVLLLLFLYLRFNKIILWLFYLYLFVRSSDWFFGLASEANFKRKAGLELGVVIRDHNKSNSLAGFSSIVRRI